MSRETKGKKKKKVLCAYLAKGLKFDKFLDIYIYVSKCRWFVLLD